MSAQANPSKAYLRNKSFPLYDNLAEIVGDTAATGEFALEAGDKTPETQEESGVVEEDGEGVSWEETPDVWLVPAVSGKL